jgi:hypothetical protein
MAQTGYSVLSLYYSATAAATPTAGNLVAGELAINTADGKLFYKDSAGVVQVIGTKGGVGSSTTTQVLYNNAGTIAGSANFVFDGTNVGIGVTPSAWGLGSGGSALQISGGAISSYTNSNLTIAQNTYFNGSDWKYKNTAGATTYQQVGSIHAWNTAASGTAGNTVTFTESMRIDSSGNLLVGRTSLGSTDAKFEVEGRYSAFNSGVGSFSFGMTGTSYTWSNTSSGSAVEAMRIDNSGNLLVGTTNSSNAAGVGTKIQNSATVPLVGVVHNSSFASSLFFSGFNENGTNNGYRFYVRTDGGIYNYSANNFNLSDRTMKKDINLSSNYLDKLCQIPVKTFLYNDQDDEVLNVGVIAQDVEEVCPEFITRHNLGTEENPELKLGIYETDLMYAMLKAIQELKAEVDSLKQQLGN